MRQICEIIQKSETKLEQICGEIEVKIQMETK